MHKLVFSSYQPWTQIYLFLKFIWIFSLVHLLHIFMIISTFKWSRIHIHHIHFIFTHKSQPNPIKVSQIWILCECHEEFLAQNGKKWKILTFSYQNAEWWKWNVKKMSSSYVRWMLQLRQEKNFFRNFMKE